MLTEARKRELIAVRDGMMSGSGHDENRRVWLKRAGFVRRDDEYPWRWHITPAGRLALSQEQSKEPGRG